MWVSVEKSSAPLPAHVIGHFGQENWVWQYIEKSIMRLRDVTGFNISILKWYIDTIYIYVLIYWSISSSFPISDDSSAIMYLLHFMASQCAYLKLICMNWNSDWECCGPSWILSSLWQLSISGVVDSSRSVIRVLYTFSCNFSHMLLLTGFKSGEFGGHS